LDLNNANKKYSNYKLNNYHKNEIGNEHYNESANIPKKFHTNSITHDNLKKNNFHSGKLDRLIISYADKVSYNNITDKQNNSLNGTLEQNYRNLSNRNNKELSRQNSKNNLNIDNKREQLNNLHN
jgi:hypothetical protein